jgi:hypothetical protein
MKQRLFKTAGMVIVSIVPALFLGILPGTAHGQIIVNDGNGLGEFGAYGISVNTNLVTGLGLPQGIAISGTNLFVVNFGNGINGTIGEYTLSGAIVNTNLITGLNGPEGIAISGTNLFVANYGNGVNGTIGEYSTSGATNNAHLITGLIKAAGIAISGTNLFVGGGSYVGEYTTSGATNNAHLISGFITAAGLAIGGSNLFVVDYGRNRIGEYTLSGAIVNTNLITVSEPNGLAVSGNLLFVVNSSGIVGEYTTVGATNNRSLFSVAPGSYLPFGIIVLPDTWLSVPTTLAASLAATNAIFSWPTNAFAYQLQTSQFLAPAGWALITNTPVVTNGNFGISLDTSNQSQFFRLQSVN